MNNKIKLPQIKKSVWSFLNDEEGKIIKKNALKIGVSVALLGLIADKAAAQHSSCWQPEDHTSHSNSCPADNTSYNALYDSLDNVSDCPSYVPCDACPSYYDAVLSTNLSAAHYVPNYVPYGIYCPTGHFVAVCPTDYPQVYISVNAVNNPCPTDFTSYTCGSDHLSDYVTYCPTYCATDNPTYCPTDYPTYQGAYYGSDLGTYYGTYLGTNLAGNYSSNNGAYYSSDLGTYYPGCPMYLCPVYY
jgi:hypothetical protein